MLYAIVGDPLPVKDSIGLAGKTPTKTRKGQVNELSGRIVKV
jgi:hypothetical protein